MHHMFPIISSNMFAIMKGERRGESSPGILPEGPLRRARRRGAAHARSLGEQQGREGERPDEQLVGSVTGVEQRLRAQSEGQPHGERRRRRGHARARPRGERREDAEHARGLEPARGPLSFLRDQPGG